jgi:hypothetical protein
MRLSLQSVDAGEGEEERDLFSRSDAFFGSSFLSPISRGENPLGTTPHGHRIRVDATERQALLEPRVLKSLCDIYSRNALFSSNEQEDTITTP